MIVSIMQPAYLPWLGYFHRIAISDLHIVLDHVKIDKNSKTKFSNRNKIRTEEGWQWLTVPIQTKGKSGDLEINRLAIDAVASWQAKHWGALRFNYAKAPQFPSHAAFFERCYSRSWQRLVDVNRETTNYLLRALGISTPMLVSSEMNFAGQKDKLIFDLCHSVGATHYLSGPFGRNYLQPELFDQAGITLNYHNYLHPEYPQVYPGFEPYMSAVDLLFNCGDDSREILMNGQPIL